MLQFGDSSYPLPDRAAIEARNERRGKNVCVFAKNAHRMMPVRMRDLRKEQDFLDIFDTHADEFFSYCASRIPDQIDAHEALEDAFKTAWDETEAGQPLRLERFYRLLDEAVSRKTDHASAANADFFGSFKRTTVQPS